MYSLALIDNELYVGGYFYSVGSISSSTPFGFLRLDLKSNEWSQPGGAIQGTSSSRACGVHAIAVDGKDIYIGGDFTMADDQPSYYFAHWSPKTSSVGMATVVGR